MLEHKNKNSTKLETCDRIWEELVSIPMHPNLSEFQVEKIIDNVNSLDGLKKALNVA